jgi:succinate dehydrogenase/fumarate reductase flavoprotein subunit
VPGGWSDAGTPAGEPDRLGQTAPDQRARDSHAAAGGGDRRIDGVRGQLRRLMTGRAGVLRSHDGLAAAAAGIIGLSARLESVTAAGGRERWEVANLLQIGSALTRLAANREESRGAHSRSDHPDPVEAWRLRQVVTRRPDGGLDQGTIEVPAPEEARR